MATQLDVVTQLAGLLGGTRTTNTADTSALRNVLAQLQAQDPNAGIESLFQKATGQMPGIQNALGNAMGARRSSNGGIEAALQKLLQDTTVAAQSQVAQQQQRNLEAQGNVAANIANATKTTQQKTNLGDFAKNLLIMQGLSKAKGMDLGSMFSSMSSPLASMDAPLSSVSQDFGSSLSGDITSPNGMDFNSLPSTSFDFNSLLGDMDFSGFSGFSDSVVDFGSGLADTLSSGNAGGVDFGGGGLLDELADYNVFADGGLVGRDGKMPGFADGGSVTLNAAGGRRSSAKTVQLNPITRTGVDNTVVRPQAVAPSAQAGSSGSMSSGSMNGGTRSSYGGEASELSEGIRTALGIGAKVNSLAGALGNPTIPGLGMINSLAQADTREQALRAFALSTLGLISPPAALAMNIMMPSPDLSPAQATKVLENAAPSIAYDTSTMPTEADVTAATPTAGAESSFDTGYTGGQYGGTGAGYGSSSSPDGGAGMGLSMGNVLGTGGYSTGGGAFRFANGGEVAGPGTGTSDSIPARLSDGEYVIPKDVVDAVGVEFFDMLREALHTPAAMQRK